MRRVLHLLTSWDKKTTLAMLCLAMFASLLMIAASWWAGPIPQLTAGHDLIGLLEGAWKWKWGIVPHHDYYSPFGVLITALIFLGLKMTGSLLLAMPAAICAFAIFILPVCVYLTFTRLPPVVAMIATVSLMATCLAPHLLKLSSEDLGYACIYNRWAYDVFLVALLAITGVSRCATQRNEAMDGLIAGLFIAIGIFLKISYGLLSITAFFGYILFIRRKPVYYAGAFAGFVLGTLACGFLIKWDYAAFLQNMTLAAHARSGLGISGMRKEFFFLYAGIAMLFALALIACVIPRLFDLDKSRRNGWRIMALAGGCVFYSVAIIMSNAPGGYLPESPVLNIGSLVILGEIIQLCRLKPDATITLRPPKLDNLAELEMAGLLLLVPLAFILQIFPYGGHLFARDFALLALALFIWRLGAYLLQKYPHSGQDAVIVCSCVMTCCMVLPVVMRNIEGISVTMGYKIHGVTLGDDEVFQSGNLKGLQIQDMGGEPIIPTTYIGKALDGLDLINRTGNSGKSVEAFDFSNPFNIAQGIKSPAGCPTCWHLNVLFSEKAAPDVGQVFNGVEVVMLPKIFGATDQGTRDVLQRLYGGYLRAHFKLAGESDQWWIWERS